MKSLGEVLDYFTWNKHVELVENEISDNIDVL